MNCVGNEMHPFCFGISSGVDLTKHILKSVMDIQSYTKYQNLTFVFAFEKHSCHPFVKEEMFPGNIKELQK